MDIKLTKTKYYNRHITRYAWRYKRTKGQTVTYMCGAGTAYPSVAPGLQRPTCVEQELLTFRGTWVTTTYMCVVGTAYPSVAPELQRPTCVEQELPTLPWHLSAPPDLHMCSRNCLPFHGTWVTATYMCGAGTAYPSVAPEFTPGFLWGSCYSVINFLCCVL